MGDALPVVSLRLAGGAGAPRQARAVALAALGDFLSAAAALDVALVVSELVTNSVQHAAVGPTQRLGIEVGVLGDRVLIAVSDDGSRSVPHLTRREPEAPEGLGLLLVHRLARSWAVARDGTGGTRVWCELALQAVEPQALPPGPAAPGVALV
jgi:two-component sensor histidine kinase